jgi:adenosylcobinamide-phosphate synthase
VNRGLLLPAVYLTDQIAGDPEWFPHPVRLMGFAITRGEAALRRPQQSKMSELIVGAALTATVVSVSYFATALAIRQAYRRSKTIGWLTEIVLGWTCLAARNLRDEASAVLAALNSGNMELARRRLARIVGRDTSGLDVDEICRAVIETVAESASDGIIAPIVYMSLGGVPLAMAYKAINTLDSMIGHTDERYFYFGKAAARLDDAANFLPARLTALAIAVAAWASHEGDPLKAFEIWLRDGSKHKSPNAGQPESAMAGALQVRVGGANVYAGEPIPAALIGEEFPAPQLSHAYKAIRIVSAATLVALGAGMLLGALLRPRKAR